MRELRSDHNLPGWGVRGVQLRALPLEEADALLAGRGAPAGGLRWHEDYPMVETLDALAMLVEAHRASGWPGESVPQWWLHQIVLVGTVVGDAGFHGPPATGWGLAEVEIGYNVVASLRGRGVAGRACQLVLAQAWADGAAVVRAQVVGDNVASVRVLQGAGFAHDGSGGFVIARPRAGR